MVQNEGKVVENTINSVDRLVFCSPHLTTAAILMLRFGINSRLSDLIGTRWLQFCLSSLQFTVLLSLDQYFGLSTTG